MFDPSDTAHMYRVFGERDAMGYSPLYADWALAIANSPAALRVIDSLPKLKRQPNLVFASARKVGVTLAPWAEVEPWFLAHWDAIRVVAMTHATQTNEAARCALYLPFLAEIEGPIALLEVGTSAGLCLLPDRYSYRYQVGDEIVRLDPDDGPSELVIGCALEGIQPPSRMPTVVWRHGIDLNPLDISDEETAQWLELLVWPEHDERRETLRSAARVARANTVTMHQGDLLTELDTVATMAPAGATLVVFHTAVLAYLPQPDRERFAQHMGEIDAIWISNEGEFVFDAVAERLPAGTTVGSDFILAINGEPRALTQPHGQRITAL